jgi:hypothetical protein
MVGLTQLKEIERAAEAMLLPLAAGTPQQIAAALWPREDDYAAVFVGDAALAARAGYASMWAAPPGALGKSGQTEVKAFAALASALRSDNEFSREFPGGYRKIADQLHPDQVWLRFKFVPPGGNTGMSYDGLVWLGGRWACWA